MDNPLTRAIKLHEAGRLEEAAACYQQLLSADPQSAEALHLLGVLRHQQGDHQQAVDLIGRATVLQPGAAVFHANLAEAFRAQGDFERAAGASRMALQLTPDFPEAHSNLALALHRLGKLDDAVRHLQRALELRPDFPAAQNNLGIISRELRRYDAAEGHFREAIRLEPTFAAAWTNLGQLLTDQGKAEQALAACQQAVHLSPNQAEAYHNLGNAHVALEQPLEARACYLEAIRLDSRLAEPHGRLGMLLMGEAKPDEALTWLQRAVELDPANFEFLNSLAELHELRERTAEALKCRERVVELNPDDAEARVNLGWAFQDDRRMDAAGEQYQVALRLDPELPLAHFHLGGWYEELGELWQAEQAFRESLKCNPEFAMPLARLALLLRGKLPDADLKQLEQRVQDASLDDDSRLHLLYGLGQVLDARNEFERAAEIFQQSSKLKREVFLKSLPEYQVAVHENFVEQMCRKMTAEFFARLSGHGSQTELPVFVCGLPRSGTTLVEQILASHSQVLGAGELRFGRQSFERIPQELSKSGTPLQLLRELDGPAINRLAERHHDQLKKLADGRFSRVVDKMPDNYLYLGILAAMFPRATFIHCRRDLRDVAVSCWTSNFRRIPWANDFDQLASRIRQHQRIMSHWRSVLPARIVEIRYEDLVGDLEAGARRLLTACGLDWEPQCLEFHQTRRPVRTASVVQVRQPLYSRSVGRWKNYARELGDLFDRLPADE